MVKRFSMFILVPCILLAAFSCAQKTPSQLPDNTVVERPAQIGLDSQSDNAFRNNSDILVAFFSATGNTKAVAETIARLTNADLYEILPKEEYKDADLDWNNTDSRAYIEMHDEKFRPEIGSEDIDISSYSVIYLGYPIWFGDAPRIVSSFVEKYDFSEKTVIPFCTSGQSGITASATNLKKQAGSGEWEKGKRFKSNATEKEVEEFVQKQLKR